MFSIEPPARPPHKAHKANKVRMTCALPLLALALAVAGCPDDSGDTADTTDASDTTPGGRSFLLAARAEGYDIARARPFYATLDTLTFPPAAENPADPISPEPPPDRPLEALVLPVDL
ncbi:MAG TPA: hypothetical protein PK095_16425, partial [Myxococcota bacterium]|nr:hypothetical protein [Myxococcota bacterium]